MREMERELKTLCTRCDKELSEDECFGDFYCQVCCWDCLRREVDTENKTYAKKSDLRREV